MREVVQVAEVGDEIANASPWIGRNGSVRCPKCGGIETEVRTGKCRDELVATVGPAGTRGKVFSHAVDNAAVERNVLLELEKSTLAALGVRLPASLLPRWSGIVNPSIYGIETHADFLNGRQRLVLILLIKALRDEYDLLCESAGEETARTVTCLLSGLIDQLVDWNCRLSMWISQNEQVGRAFCGPGVPMLWDYVESDPVGKGPANLWKKLERIAAGAEAICQLQRPANVQRAYAQELPFEDKFFDAIVTDPPYYDNIYYNVLADFFYSWKRVLFESIEPGSFKAEKTDDTRELVASSFRSGEPSKAHEDYCQELGQVMAEAERVLRMEGVFSLLYSHASLGGWEALVRAYRPTGLWITSVQPLSIERKQRPRAMTSEAINTCLVFVAHRGERNKRRRSIESMSEELRQTIAPLIDDLRAAGWHDTDIGVATYAQGVGMLANVAGIAGGKNDTNALRAFGSLVAELVPGFRVTERKSL